MEMTKKGIFYGVGIGPGDPELLTLKAVRVLEACQVIAAPQTKSEQMLALDIASAAVDLSKKELVPLFFTMEREKERQHAAHLAAADRLEAYLANGQDVAMLNLGDVSIYATYSYLMEILKKRGYETVMIPGVPSFCAVAARLGESLTEMNTPLHILPAGAVPLSEVLAMSGTKVLMKSGKRLHEVADALDRQGLLSHAKMVKNCGLPDERVCTDLYAQESAGYFATIIVKE